MLRKKGKRCCLSSLVLSSASTGKMTVPPPPTGYKTTKIAFRFHSQYFVHKEISHVKFPELSGFRLRVSCF